MPNYRRNRVEGGSYFFTVNLRDRRSDLLVAEIGAASGSVRGSGGNSELLRVWAEVAIGSAG